MDELLSVFDNDWILEIQGELRNTNIQPFLVYPVNLDGIRNTGTECPYDGLIETNFDGTGYPTNWLYQFDSVLHLVMYKDPQGDSLWHPLWPGLRIC